MLLETGAIVQVTHASTRQQFKALVETKSDTTAAATQLSFCAVDRPYEKLRVALTGHVGWAIAATKFASFQLQHEAQDQAPDTAAAASPVRFRSLAHQKKASRDGTVGWYLGVQDVSASRSDELALIGDASGVGEQSLFLLEVVSARAAFALDATRMVFRQDQSQLVSKLSQSQRVSFMRNGFLQIRDAVPMKLVNAALRRINHELGVPGRMIDGGVEGAAKLAGNTSNCEDILNLFNLSDAHGYAEALIGPGRVAAPQGAQIALRFPELGEPREPLGTEWHTDGMRQGQLHPFSLLVGVTLSDVREPNAGNFTVFPGSHINLQHLLRENGTLDGYADQCVKAESVWGEGTLPDLGTPVQLLASRGDIVLAHPNLAHRGGLNFSPDVRYQIYFRLKHVHYAALQPQAHENLWIDLEGLQDLVE